ncbi:hypothetical protein EW146_g418 [Bondarzewia mesenterica]|uniref:Phosphatidylinositol-specific phospholipase C X domain-containing protein n=1 Tax=Bondarzewia mesenterica TaxID=1095465 RepID=A0A4S4M721_9AGAM|nr:hypothetical protein EW146_g418 [Bondarzewia mesenterica]
MHLTFVNLSVHPVSIKATSRNDRKEYTLLSKSLIELRKADRTFSLAGAGFPEEKYGWPTLDKVLPDEEFYVKVIKTGTSPWTVAKVSQSCPWRVYCRRVSRKRTNVLIFENRNLASFLSEIPDAVPLSSLCLPGTHDTMAFYGWPISQCQSADTALPMQLVLGIRLLDIRLSLIKGRLISYHSSYPQRTPFLTILSDLHAFLTSSISFRETVVVSIKQEDMDASPVEFSAAVKEEIMQGPGGIDMWFLENRIPMLGEVRGRAVLFSRFGADGSGWERGLEGMGIHPTNWPDSEKHGFTWELKGTLVRTHDWYHIPSFLSIPEKTQLSTSLLVPPSNDLSNPVLSITYFSASSFPFATPTVVSTGFGWPSFGFGVEGVNSRVGGWLLDALSGTSVDGKMNLEDGPRIRAWTLMDFFLEPGDAGVVPLLVECNFRGRMGERL